MATDTPKELLAKLLKRREELRLESEALEQLIKTYQKLLMLPQDPPENQLDLWKTQHSKKAKSAYVAEMLADARRMIIDAGQPLTRSDLLRRLEGSGYVIDGRDRSKVLGTNIWRSGRFIHVEGVGYWPKDIPLPRSFA
jgi:hypothetical protein